MASLAVNGLTVSRTLPLVGPIYVYMQGFKTHLTLQMHV